MQLLGAERRGDGWRLDGVKLFVPDAGAADYMVAAARTRPAGEEGVSLFLVEGRPAGLSVSPLKTMDMTRRWYEVRFEGVELPGDALMGKADGGWPPLKRTCARQATSPSSSPKRRTSSASTSNSGGRDRSLRIFAGIAVKDPQRTQQFS